MKGYVTVLKPGLYTTIQDRGRFGFAKYGVPQSGAMDQFSFEFANLLLGNYKNDACIEWVIQPPTLQFNSDTRICLTGAEVDAFLNNQEVEMYQQITVSKNDILTLKSCRNNIYGYVGIRNGFLTEVVMESRSFYDSITSKQKLVKGDKLEYNSNINSVVSYAHLSAPKYGNSGSAIEVFKGPEFDQLSSREKDLLLKSRFTINGASNRMAIQFMESISNSLPQMLTSPVLPGTVQLTPSGKLIVLMRDCQTTGGYPRVLQLTEIAINTLAQTWINEQIQFQLVDF
ncbi:biotin-dependent carboxyltransferase family protein [Aquimarina spongiae]|uniref:Biotin-dependent carboxylase uncharacterized domain-containing protein n=1 Tax=Aquimarina spongiae TaxID=570521 RepID=A0A1M6GAA4_9FLAO|nr:biotin-dependent carboxyltransferase family protein [Aquimarina spongiae]SHJ06893.1 biotin-dependent carboxylase uncharacterized domain-containing protein [Aquimarina spongiae]